MISADAKGKQITRNKRSDWWLYLTNFYQEVNRVGWGNLGYF